MRTVRKLGAAILAVLLFTLLLAACGSEGEDKPATNTTTSTTAPAPVDWHAAYMEFVSVERQTTIDKKLEECGGALLNLLLQSRIPADRSLWRGGALPENYTGIGMLSSSPAYIAAPGYASVITLTVSYTDGQPTQVHGVQVALDNTVYTLNGLRTVQPDGQLADHGTDAHTWNMTSFDGRIIAVSLSEPGRLRPLNSAEHPGRVTLLNGFAVLGIGLNQWALAEGDREQISAAELRRADNAFLANIPCK